jgi:hypothetical protein
MKFIFINILSILASASASAQITITFTNKAGEVISNAPLITMTGTMLFYETPSGGGDVKLAELPPALQKQIGYEPGKGEPKSVHTVAGDFGFTLGARMDSRPCSASFTNTDGQTLVFMTSNYPPFASITVGILNDRRIYIISAKYKGDNWTDQRSAIMKAFAGKYGPARHVDAFGAAVTEWGDDHRTVSIGDQTVDYVDMDLLKTTLGAKGTKEK